MARTASIPRVFVPLLVLGATILGGCASTPPASSMIEPPAAPSDLTVVLHPEGVLVLEWRDNAVDETSFLVVEDCGGARGWVGSIGQDQTRVAVEAAPPETTCSFVIFAANRGGLSGPSNVATIAAASTTSPTADPRRTVS